jgi:hypothetical protein
MITGHDEEADPSTTTYPGGKRRCVSGDRKWREGGFFVVPNRFCDIRLQRIDQADETDNDKLRIKSVDKLVKAFSIGINLLRKEFTRYDPPCK